MRSRVLFLRRPDACSVCGSSLGVGTQAWWDPELRCVTCPSCHEASPGSPPQTPAEPEIDPPRIAIDPGTAGASSEARYQYLHAARESRIDAKFGRLAGVVKFITDDPQSTKAWKVGSIGERHLAADLASTVGDQAVLLHDRKVPKTRGNIDHLAVAANGVWVIDAKNYRGVIQRRDVGNWRNVDYRLFVGGRDRTKVVDGLSWQVDAVKRALCSEDVPIHAAVCFTDAEWGWLTKPFELRNVLVTGPRTLAKRVSEPGELSPDSVLRIASTLSQALPVK